MKRNLLTLTLTPALLCGVVIRSYNAQEQSKPASRSSPIQATFALPPSQPLDLNKPISCTAIASASLYEAPERRGKITGKINPGTDRLALEVKGDTLLVNAKGTFKDGAAGLDKYRITGHTKGWLSAVHDGGLMPMVYSIVLNKQNGFAVWSLNEPMFIPASEYPYGQTIYLRCGH